MVNCPNCGAKQTSVTRTVTALQVKNGILTPEYDVEIFECPKCKYIFNPSHNAFRQKRQQQNNESSVTVLYERLSEVQLGFKQNIANLRRNLATLETERPSVLLELETLRKDSESRAVGLEEDVNRLRGEIRDLREVLGLNAQ
jgi:rubredoxin